MTSGRIVSRACSRPRINSSLRLDSSRKGLSQKLFSTRKELNRMTRLTPMALTDRSALLRTLGLGRERTSVTGSAGGGVFVKHTSISRKPILKLITLPVPTPPPASPTHNSSSIDAW